MSLATNELARLRIPLSALPGFDTVGLVAYGRPVGRDDHVQVVRFVANVDGRTPAWVALIPNMIGRPTAMLVVNRSIEDIQVDLADPSTADRVARWLAVMCGLKLECTAPEWFVDENEIPFRWMLQVSFESHGWDERMCLALYDLDLDDKRCLPDGSRYVDRLALAVVAMHVGTVKLVTDLLGVPRG